MFSTGIKTHPVRSWTSLSIFSSDFWLFNDDGPLLSSIKVSLARSE